MIKLDGNVIPDKLNYGDTIGIIAPSKPMVEEAIQMLKTGIKNIEGLGFQVKLGKNVFSNKLRYSASPEEKADDINTMFQDKEVKMILSACGGENSFSCLPFIDYEIIKNNPKILCGFSDSTNYLDAIYTKTGLLTYYQTEVLAFDGSNQFEIEDFKLRFVEGKIGNTRKKSEWKCLKYGNAAGILVGGNLPSMCNLVGTEYMPDVEGRILLLEAYRTSTNFSLADNYVHRLKYHGIFENIKGLIIGHYAGDTEELKIEDVFLNNLKEYNFPILKCEDIGHNCENIVIPIGGNIRLDATNGEIEILDCIVK